MILLLTPILLGLMAFLGLGAGIIISSLTTKYRDFTFLVAFGVQLAMYATPVIYPVSMVPEKYAFWLNLNPMAPVIETFRAIYLGGTIPWEGLGISAAMTAVLMFLGIVMFKKVERSFMDTV
jgi:lipopolysaccharide transport system permease protein